MIKFFMLVSVLILAGCATSYQKDGFTGGYKDMKLGQDLYQVSFKGNGYTKSDRVQKHFLHRCAELTIEQGYDYFVFVNQEAGVSHQNLGTNYNGNISQNYFGGYNYSGTVKTTTITTHEQSGVIKLFQDGTQPPIAYEAQEVLKSMED